MLVEVFFQLTLNFFSITLYFKLFGQDLVQARSYLDTFELIALAVILESLLFLLPLFSALIDMPQQG